jgi:LmbE family N-acetylglucosaminyl deacetylase
MMLPLLMGGSEARPARLLVIGAHSGDTETGCGGTILDLVEEKRKQARTRS